MSFVASIRLFCCCGPEDRSPGLVDRTIPDGRSNQGIVPMAPPPSGGDMGMGRRLTRRTCADLGVEDRIAIRALTDRQTFAGSIAKESG
jgi:hypothetical protein